MNEPGPVPSPCIGLCRLDDAGEQCLGCRRTIDEIARWTAMPPAERRAVLDDLPRRQGKATEAGG